MSPYKYIARRLIQTVVVLALASVAFFLLIRAQPITPCGFGLTRLSCQESLNLDQPIGVQYLDWSGAVLHGNLGVSITGQPVTELISQRLPPTIVLVGVSLVLQQLLALPLGILAAVRQYSLFDSGLTVLAYAALSLPPFLLGMILIALCAVSLHVLPVGHSTAASLPMLGSPDWWGALAAHPALLLGDAIQHLILPVLTLTATGVAIDSRFMRASMLQVMRQDYMRTARAKGLMPRTVLFKHAFRNAVLPIITNIGLYLPALLAGTVAVETVFTWDGLGYAFAQAAGAGNITFLNGGTVSLQSPQDFPTLTALLMLSTLAVLLANLLADIAYALLDPRVGAAETVAQ